MRSNQTQKQWDHFGHGSDIGVKGWGKTRKEAFENAALALTAVITDPSKVHCHTKVLIADRLTSDDDAILFFDWLNAVIFHMATDRMIFGKFDIAEDQGLLTGWAWGEPIDEEIHDPAVEIKGATMTGLSVEKNAEGRWIAACIVDV